MIKATAVEDFSAEIILLLKKELPTFDRLFSIAAALLKNKKIVFKSDEKECGALLYSVLENFDGAKIFFISALAINAKLAPNSGDVIYNWMENEARSLGCTLLIFDSPRRGMLFHARKYNWSITNIRYQKEL